MYEVNSRMGPAARILLEESHLPLSAVRPTGPHHIVTKGDVLAAIAAAAAAKGAGQPAAPQVGGGRSTEGRMGSLPHIGLGWAGLGSAVGSAGLGLQSMVWYQCRSQQA